MRALLWLPLAAAAVAQTPVLVADIQPGAGNATAVPVDAIDVEGTLYFRASNGPSGTELFRSDGTVAGTRLVKDIFPGLASSVPTELTELHGRVLFSALAGLNESELFVSDGSEAGTVKIELVPGPLGSFPRDLVAAGPRVFFTAATPAFGRELWTTDGTVAGTRMVADLSPGPQSSQFRQVTAVQERVFFVATTPSFGSELWVSDGTAAGTRLVRELRPGPASASITELTALGNRLYFAGFDGAGQELWSSDGTASGTYRTDLLPGPSSSSPRRLTRVGRRLFFVAEDASGRTGLWVVELFGRLRRVCDLQPAGSMALGEFVAVSERLFFSLQTVAEGRELWTSDGTAAGTVIVRDLAIGSASSNPSILTAVGSRYLVFQADDGRSGKELWRSDGTPLGTRQLGDLRRGSADSFPDSIAVSNGIVFFFASTDSVGRELHRVELGALAQAFGAGCGSAGRVPELRATDPVTFGTMTLAGDQAPAGASCAVLLGRPAASPLVLFGCRLYLAPFAPPTTLAAFPVPFTGFFTRTIPAPTLPVGMRFVLQASFGALTTRLVERSNPVLLVGGW
ncbi:MAG: hypothetical protein R3F56_23140 [Planctomycetota bacterium]